MEKNRRKKAGFLDYIQTYWPIVVVIGAFVVWAIKVQTVSPATFNETVNELSTRVTVVEEQMPDKKSMLKIHENQAVMKQQLSTFGKSLGNIERILNKR